MCMMSMIVDRSYEYLKPYVQPMPNVWPAPNPWQTSPLAPKPVPPEMIDFIEKLMRDAKKNDDKTGQGGCELTEKRKKLEALANELKIKIAFPE